MPKLRAIWTEESGQDMVEYALLLGLVALLALGLLSGLKAQTVQIWQGISRGFTSAGLAS